MRRSAAAALALTVLLFGGAYLAAGKHPAQETEPDGGAVREQSAQGQKDGGVQLAVKNGDAVESMALDVYLQGVVRGEMPASFELEALKAQAAAERTYIYYQLAAGRKEAHPNADVCTDPSCCNAWLSEEAAREKWGGDFDGWESRIEEAVAATDGQVALYDGQPILAVFHSSSAGKTRTASAPRVTAPQNVAEQLGLRVKTIVIDPGHGGKDPGTSHNNIVERELTLDVAKRLGSVLRAAGYNVVFTRSKDNWISLSERSNIAVRKKGDLFISIHVNASTKPGISGFETYYLDLAGTKESIRLAAVENAGMNHRLGEMESILADLLLSARIQESRRLAAEVQKNAVSLIRKRGHQVNNNGTKGAPFHVLIGSSMPGVLVEIGYCTNSAEARRLKQSKYRDALAEGIANGVHHYARQLELAGK